MDVRCEKCQTEYELDESRLKPGGVTVKCTSCGHMFKIRKRTITNVGLSPAAGDPAGAMRARTASSKPLAPPASPAMASAPVALPARPRGDSLLDDDARALGDDPQSAMDRQWLIRLDNGEQKTCRELATLQQWIITGVVTRESLISRTGKTWKRIGDLGDLGQYFAIADEARANRDRAKQPARSGAPTVRDPEPRAAGTPVVPPPGRSAPVVASAKDVPGTMPGYGAQAAGGTILPDDDEPPPARATAAYQNRPVVNTPPPVPTRGGVRTPALGQATVPTMSPPAMAPPTVIPPGDPAGTARDARVTPPPPPPRRPDAASGPSALVGPPAIPPPQGNRATAMWANQGLKEGLKPGVAGVSQTGPFVGKLSAAPDEPAFAGRVRIAPSDEARFESGRVRAMDDDDGVLPARRSSRAGMWVLVMALLVMGAGAAGIYLFVIRGSEPPAGPPADSGSAVGSGSAQAVAPAPAVVADAAALSEPPPIAGARAELAADLESRLRTAAQSLEARPDAPSQALRAHLLAQLAQDLQDRAALIASPEADGLRRDGRQLVLDAATAAQRALRAAGDDAGANLAMAEVLRLQGKPAADVKRYLDTARARPDKDWALELALADALVLARDGKLDEARAAFAAIDQGDGKLETAGDVRARLHLALVLAAQGSPADARPLVEAILAAQPEHAGARALAARLDTTVAKTDPLPPEDGDKAGSKDAPKAEAPKDSGATKPPASPRPTHGAPGAGAGGTGGGESYDRLLARGNALADTSCARAMELYAKALEQKPNGVEALVGMGYCHIDAKQFASAFSKFRAALAVSPRYEPALRGVAEAYQQQGRREQAIEAYKAYLDVYPNSAAAKKQLERLGGDAAPAAPSAPPPAPTAPAPTAPAPDPAGTGAGSG